jgi:ATP-dependent DNA helicase RecQ
MKMLPAPRRTALNLLKQSLNDPAVEFRDGQWSCIEALLSKRRILVVQRTGWGKSMVYFLATRMLRDAGEGLTLLISPLLSLMRNQILAAQRIGIRAETINSANQEDWAVVRGKVMRNEVDILLISPERLANGTFREDILIPMAGYVGLFVVDEAHCISDWGHDFRPDYRRIVRVLRALPKNIPVLATTATANNRVVADVATQLGDLRIERGPLARSSLRLQNIWLPSPAARMAWIAGNLPRMPGSGIVYTLTQRDAERLAHWLRRNGIDARAYHADVEDREGLENMLLSNRIKALVATVALGMGFDKPDLGFVIHFQRPGSVVHYYQQVGRAGRALDEAYGILLSGREDDEIIEYFIRTAFPPQAHIEEVLGALNAAREGLSVPMLQQKVNLRHGEIEKTLKYLSVESPAPIVKQGARWYATAIDYEPDREAIAQLCRLRRAEQEDMVAYMRTESCLMQFLSTALDDPRAEPCGRCANCLGQPLWPESIDTDLANAASLFLKRNHQAIVPRKTWPPAAFPVYGYRGRIAVGQTAREGRALCLWGDEGWGRMVEDGKYQTGRFSDDLVDACQQMIDSWSPDPFPLWITCVPSLTRPELVADFAQRLAARLEMRFMPLIRKIRSNRPQKEMQNSFKQAKNLDGVFALESDDLPEGPVLLVDDMVDSGWTFTVTAALLRDAGCPVVFPLALAMSSHGNG